MIIDMKKKKQNEEILDCEVIDLNIKDIIPNCIDNVIVFMDEGHHNILMPPSMSKDKYTIWIHNKGGIFSKDVHNFSLNKEHGKYVLMTYKDKKIIARIIEDEEFDRFKSLNLVDGLIKDKYYMILKKLDVSDSLISTKISEKVEIIEEIEVMSTVKQEIDIEPQIDLLNPQSISLFNN
jgi:hypothetical protein